jgi:hypothetical protein
VRANGLEGGHVDFDSGHPGLLKDLSRGVLIVRVLQAPLRPEKIKDETTKDIEGLPVVEETPDVVPLQAGWVISTFEDGFAQQNEQHYRYTTYVPIAKMGQEKGKMK